MKGFKLIISVIVLAGLFVSLSGRIIHLNYCFNEQKYTLDFSYSSDKGSSLNGCRCESEMKSAATASARHSCCSPSEKEETKGLCCLDVKADSVSDSYYTFIYFNPDFKAKFTDNHWLNQPMSFNFFYNSSFGFQTYCDHSPPEIIATQVLLI